MNYKVLNINIDYKKIGTDNGGYQPTMTLYLPDDFLNSGKKRPTVVVCPGGGYAYTSVREAEPIALNIIANDCNAVVLRYSCAPANFPCQLLEVAYTVAKLRENAEEWHINTEKIVVMGFSAGGHVAASYGSFWNKDFVKGYFGFKNEENKPNGMILCYPVISSGEKAHRGSFDNLLGAKKDDGEMLELVSIEKQVNKDTPKAFIWHTYEDGTVPVENSLMMASALVEKKIPTELHIFPHGWHGLSLCNNMVYKEADYHGQFDECQAWFGMAMRWLKNL